MASYLFGQYLLEQGLVNVDQLNEGLVYQRKNNKVIGEVAVEQEFLDRSAVAQICEWQLCQDKDFGELAVELGFLSKEKLKKVLEFQRKNHQYLGQILVRLGHLSTEALQIELNNYRELRDSKEDEIDIVEEDLAENPAAVLFNLAAKMLPRMTRGRVLAGGFYPTIAEPPWGHAFSQRLRGNINMEAALNLPEDLFIALGGLIVDSGTAIGKPGGRRRYDAAVKNLINKTLELFAARCEEKGKTVSLVDKPKRQSRDVLKSRRGKAVAVHCAEFFLINPPDPKGDFLQFHICLMFG